MLIDQSFDYLHPTAKVVCHIDCFTDTSDLHYGKYNCPMAVYLDIIVGRGYEDDWAGDSDLGESTSRVGRWLISYDDRGFIEAYKYDSLADAEAEMERIRDAFAALDDQGDDTE